jgi:hypothetical protein
MRPRYVARAHIVAEMRTHVRVTAAALILLGLMTGCSRTTEGSVAMTTQPGPPLTSTPPTTGTFAPTIPGLPNIPLPDIPIPGFPRQTDVPVVPAPANSKTMTCKEFTGLDEATRLAVIRAILADKNNPLGPNGESVGQVLAEAACQFLPSATVSEVLMGSPPG